jgi:RNA polymerase sigma-70 factor (ECF subfamily)
MSADTTNPSLLERVRDAGDTAAWRQFDGRYGPLVLGYCRARGLQLSDAEDVRQQVMLSLSRALPGFAYDRSRGRFRDYLARVVRNAVARRRACHTASITTLSNNELDALTRAPQCLADEEWERQWAHHHCRRALAALRPVETSRNLAVLERLLAGRSSAAIADELGLTAEAVRKIKQRLRERLRALVVAQLAEEERPIVD